MLSGGSEEELNDLIIDSREEWDCDWKEKKYYSKATDREMLFHRIPYKAKLSPEMQIRLVYYPDVFKAISRSGLDSEVAIYMEELLLPIHARNYSGKEYNNMMTSVRKCIELIFTSMAENGILPNNKKEGKYVLNDILVDSRGGINTTWCSLILSGKDVKVEDKIRVKSINILPNVLKESFQRLKEISAAYEHVINKNADEQQHKNSRKTPEFLNSIGDSPYLLQSMALELCTIILWYANYLEDHDDEELNALNWNIIQ